MLGFEGDHLYMGGDLLKKKTHKKTAYVCIVMNVTGWNMKSVFRVAALKHNQDRINAYANSLV